MSERIAILSLLVLSLTVLIYSSGLEQNSVSSAQAIADESWPSFFHDYSHTSLSQFVGTSSNVTKWKFNANNGASALVLGQNDTIYFGSWDHLYALNRDGSLRFKIYIGGLVDPPLLGPEGTLYLDNGGKEIFAIDPNGTTKWKFEANGTVTMPVADVHGRIYFGSNDSLYSISTDGKLLWKYKTNGIVRLPSIGPDGIIYLGDSDHDLYSIDSTGTLRWKYQADGITSFPSVSHKNIIYFCDSNNYLYAINPDGSLKWKYQSSNTDTPPAIGPDETLYLDDGSGITAITPDGIFKWAFRPANVTIQSLTVDSSGTIYAGAFENRLYALTPDGQAKWDYKSFGSVGQPTIGSDGTIYFNSGEGIIYSLGQPIPEFGSQAAVIFIITIIGSISISKKISIFKLFHL